MKRNACFWVALLAAVSLSGCVERQMTLATDPPGAKAYYNGTYVGQTPVTFHFTYYQAPDLKFEKDGYRTFRATPDVKPPLYQVFPLDLIAETSPFTFYDRRTFSYTLEAATKTDTAELVKRAEELRDETVPPR